MTYVGLVPSEESSGGMRRQGSITKVGYSRVRHVVPQSPGATAPRIGNGPVLERRQEGQPPDAVVQSLEGAARAPPDVQAAGGERRPPSNPQLPAPLDPTTEPVVGALVAKRHHPPPHSRRDADAPCRRVGGHGVGRRRRRSRVAASRREPCDSPWTSAGSADLSGVEGAEPLARPCRGPAKRGPKG